MSIRGPRGGRGRGRGIGRGRGRGKTTLWEWENYTPGPEVYEQLWRIRKEPAIVTPHPQDNCPIPNARTRVLDRRQTEGDIQRNFYIVKVTYQVQHSSSILEEALDNTEHVHVDLSRILEYVSPFELEQFENEQFRIETEAEAVALRIEAAELEQRRLKKNARASGAESGVDILSTRGSNGEVRLRGRQRGRPSGRSRGRGRASWRARGTLQLADQCNDTLEEELDHLGLEEPLSHNDEDMQRTIAETDSEDELQRDETETFFRHQSSPGMLRSAFVANSALPVSPVAIGRRLSGLALPNSQRHQTEVPDTDESDLNHVDADDESASSATMRLHLEDDTLWQSTDLEDTENIDDDQHRTKRPRIEIVTPRTHMRQWRTDARLSTPPLRSAVSNRSRSYRRDLTIEPSVESDVSSSSGSIPSNLPSRSHNPQSRQLVGVVISDTIHVASQSQVSTPVVEESEEDDMDNIDTGAEEYIVEDIMEHYYDGGKKFYLVKWAGYEDSHDWLPEEDLAGAAELLAEYNKKVRKRKV